jgi:hypothetical protein
VQVGLKPTQHSDIRLREEALEEAVATSPIENTRTELLCQWIDSLASPWAHGILEETSDSTLTIPVGAYTVLHLMSVRLVEMRLGCWSDTPRWSHWSWNPTDVGIASLGR